MSTGEQGLPRAPLLSSVTLVVGTLLPLWAVWRPWIPPTRGRERWRVSPGSAMWQPYPRMLAAG